MKPVPLIDTVIQRAFELGSNSKTTRGAVKFLLRPSARANEKCLAKQREEKIRLHIGQAHLAGRALDREPIGAHVEMPDVKPAGYFRAELPDDQARKRAFESLRLANPRKRNIHPGGPKISGPAHQADWETIHYKGAFQGWSGSSATSRYQSCICVTRSGRSAVIVTECKIIRRIIAPAGMKWEIDSDGALLRRATDGMDYHPTPEDIKARDFSARVRSAMATNYKARQAARRLEREQKRIASIYEREIRSTWVTLDDSRRAGNCIAGSITFAERHLGIDRQSIVDGQWLVSAPALRLLATGDNRAKAAVRAAFTRETTICI